MIHRRSNDLHFSQIMLLLKRRRVFIASIVLLSGAAATGIGLTLPPYYTAKAQLLYQADAQVATERSEDSAVDTLVEMLNSPGQLRRLAKSLEPSPSDTSEITPAELAQTETTKSSPPVLDYDTLDQGLNVYKERQSRLVAVTFRSIDPETAALVANRAVKLYLEHESDFQREARAQALRTVSERMPDALARIDQAEGALREHKIKFGLADSGAAGFDPNDRQIGEFSRQLIIAQSDLAARNAKLQTLSEQQRSISEGNAESQNGIEQVVGKDQTVHASSDATQPLGEDQQNEIKQVMLGRDAVAARVSDIEKRLATLQEANAKTTPAWIRLRELEREANAAGEAYENLQRQQNDLRGQGNGRLSVRIVSMADVPDLPSSPNPLLFVAPALVASLLIGGFLAVLLERLDQRLRSERDVEETLDAPCIGMVPTVPSGMRANIAQLLRNEPYAPYTEAIRSVYVAATRGSARSILVTSSALGDGKSTLVRSLAAFAERLGQRVLVIDFDLRHPQISRLIDDGKRESTPGAQTDTNDLPWEALIRTAKKDGIDYLTIPRLPVDPLTVLLNDDFPSLIKQQRQNYDCILIDSAPVGGATETRLLAMMVDCVIFTVRWGVTEAGTALAAVQQLRSSATAQGIPIAVVVNQVDLRAHRRGGYSEPVAMSPVPA
ncbi:MAG: hypothetical protein JWS10_741 [Cypionkella sp.]|uniref:GumC family protein n=1 Tax=Cypionkella sp. TaxID=2811411 RepID=UPI00261275DD|nr:GNVR domain-containing protein [Cypionkella sp.]MDB5658126.1 hypothetical protein [Cypionkella sp.]